MQTWYPPGHKPSHQRYKSGQISNRCLYCWHRGWLLGGNLSRKARDPVSGPINPTEPGQDREVGQEDGRSSWLLDLNQYSQVEALPLGCINRGKEFRTREVNPVVRSSLLRVRYVCIGTPFRRLVVRSLCAYSVAQSCPTLCNPMDCSPPGSSVHGILQGRILEWVAIYFYKGSSGPRDWSPHLLHWLEDSFFPIYF